MAIRARDAEHLAVHPFGDASPYTFEGSLAAQRGCALAVRDGLRTKRGRRWLAVMVGGPPLALLVAWVVEQLG